MMKRKVYHIQFHTQFTLNSFNHIFLIKVGEKRSIGDSYLEAKKVKKDEEDTVKIVAEDYEDIDKSNIIPRSRRRAAIASGLVGPSSSSKSKSSTNRKTYDDDDEEVDF